jgi:gas vesicle protein
MSAFLKQMDKLNNAVQTEIPLLDKQVFKKSENLIEFQMECLEALKREVEDESEEYNSEASNVVKEIEEIQSQMATLPAEQIMKNNEIDKALARFPLLKSRYDKQFVRQLEKIKPLFTLFYDHEKGNVSLKLQRWEAEESSIKLDYDISAYQTEIGQYFKAMGLDISFSDLQYSEESESYIIPKDQLGNFMERNLNPPTPENLPKQHRAEPLIHANIRSEKTEPKESESSIMKDTSSARISKKTGG